VAVHSLIYLLILCGRSCEIGTMDSMDIVDAAEVETRAAADAPVESSSGSAACVPMPTFPALSAAEMHVRLILILDMLVKYPHVTHAIYIQDGKVETITIPVPPHRYTPLKQNWMRIYTPVVENMQLQIRMNLRERCVEVKVSSAPVRSWLCCLRCVPQVDIASAPRADIGVHIGGRGADEGGRLCACVYAWVRTASCRCCGIYLLLCAINTLYSLRCWNIHAL
jgi:hypothetical protein